MSEESVLTAYDGNRPTTYETYELDSAQQEYIFRLPYDSVPGKNDMLLRVVHRDGSPAAGATCILSQDSYNPQIRIEFHGCRSIECELETHGAVDGTAVFAPVAHACTHLPFLCVEFMFRNAAARIA